MKMLSVKDAARPQTAALFPISQLMVSMSEPTDTHLL